MIDLASLKKKRKILTHPQKYIPFFSVVFFMNKAEKQPLEVKQIFVFLEFRFFFFDDAAGAEAFVSYEQ
jgi:hypothetical protein